MRAESVHDHDDDPDALEDTVADVDLDESLDHVDSIAEQAPEDEEELGGFDPEAGRTRIGGRVSISGHLTSDAGMFVIGVVAATVGLSVLIFALVNRTPVNLVIAGVISPPTLIWAFVKWRRWLGGAPYVYRMLLSLKEDEAADEVLVKHREKQRRQVEKRLAELDAKGVRIEE